MASTDIIKSKIIPVVLVTALVIGALLPSGCTKKEVTVITDKAEYEQGEIVIITIRNGLSESILVHTKSRQPGFCIENIEMKTEENHWEGLITRFPDCVSDIDHSQETEPSESITFEWAPSMIDYAAEAVQLNPGQYRLSVIYLNRENTEWKSIYTNEFTIK